MGSRPVMRNGLNPVFRASVDAGVREQGNRLRTLHSSGEIALLLGVEASDATRNDLAALGDEVAQDVRILVIKLMVVLEAKARRKTLGAALLAFEKVVSALSFEIPIVHGRLTQVGPGSTPRSRANYLARSECATPESQQIHPCDRKWGHYTPV
jgi:hypothetical protein